MKKLTTIVVIMCFCSTFKILNAQVYLGGNINFGYSSNTLEYTDSELSSKSNSNNIGFVPKLGFYLNDNIILGFSLRIERSNTSSNAESTYLSTSNRKSTNISFGPFIQINAELSDRIVFINELKLNGGLLFSTNESNNSSREEIFKSDKSGYDFAAYYQPKIGINLSNKIMLELGVGKLGYSYSITNKTNYNEDKDTKEVIPDSEKNTSDSGGDFILQFNSFSMGLVFKL